MLDKTYQPAAVEQRIYDQWESAGAFRAGRTTGAPYCIVIPPPNVTGSLHMGHALNNTLQDILIRYHRMKGGDVLWQPGTDHAGIATQMVVERQLEQRQQKRGELGRAKFLERVWEWKAESGGTIIGQLRRLGASCDWSRERFTMDEGLSAAVLKVFVDLYKQGLIYKDKRLVNWDPKLLTAISDLEVVQKEMKGHLWHLRYPVEGEPGRFIVVATTRPETMLGDTGVAVHPEDERFKDLVGKYVRLPLVGRRIPIVADEYSDPEKGTGAVKITPAHDFNDFEVGRRHSLEVVNIFDRHAYLNDAVPEAYRGLERFAARRKIVADLEALELVEKIEPHTHQVPHGDRSDVVIEPYLTDQWYVDAATLAKPAIEAVENGTVQFVPKNWEKTYFEWMRNIQPWCISRQLWWGHQIPAWYGPDNHVFVELDEAAAKQAAAKHYGRDVALTRDEDVLDTWFSSALWPFSTLGWPEQTAELKRYYPTAVLVTGFDIIFFWVARMMMMGLSFMDGREPFGTVYVHALVRDEKGQKMSKSKGNVIDPLVLIDRFGADALRFTLTALAAQGRDIKLSESRVEGYRNFATKLWNAARFTEMNECLPKRDFDPNACAETVNRWIVGETRLAIERVSVAIDAYRFNEAAAAAYQFTWGTFCDWYLELVKPLLTGPDGAAKDETRATAAWALAQLLHILHPMMPFVTEELWQRLYPGRNGDLVVDAWPDPSALEIDTAASAEINWLVDLMTAIRAARSEMNVPASAKVPMSVRDADATVRERLDRHGDVLARLARLDAVSFADAPPPRSLQIVIGATTYALPLSGIVDLNAEQARLAKEIGKAEAEAGKTAARLDNPAFVAKAPEEVIVENRERLFELNALAERLRAASRQIAE
jgi:valyl-tRNA synthetase